MGGPDCSEVYCRGDVGVQLVMRGLAPGLGPGLGLFKSFGLIGALDGTGEALVEGGLVEVVDETREGFVEGVLI